MTDNRDELLLDSDGIPLLTDLVRDTADTRPDSQAAAIETADVSTEELASVLLGSEEFKQQLDTVAGKLTRTVRQQVEQALKPIIAEAITLAFEDSQEAAAAAIRKQLEADLPELIARALKDA